ncbi:tail fiber assembly protein [Enterobacter roggenkampii]|uniref:tail fiber assembly protein n=1 Tax=Enterobacteriaceae TaxID=543 RepID=UPI000F4F08D6|nr:MULTISPECIES: tail fiber assembly protein [Enterobacteriaceae]AYY06495.1 tail fiber assembly protein [Enterobacter roggenkampii]ELS5684268.1 tail fiber assembly protein [Enterobacter roggenkampii]EMC3652949.1 tail fiber assembly protein [Citrobacter braakii]MDT7131271.1 tail fiber assembly protein [Citrobacter braakii]QMR82273.1 tail fiber assembly protein [Enterobacter roggenkampii]
MKYFTAKPIGLYNDENNIIPADAIPISEEQYQLLLEGQHNGKFIQADVSGKPVLVDELTLHHEQQVEVVKGMRAALLATANLEIAWRQDAVDAGIATEEETAALSEWKKYRVLLMRTDNSKPIWPTPPGEQVS